MACVQIMQPLFSLNASPVQSRCNWAFRGNAIRCADQCVSPLGLITFSLVWLMPQVNYEEAQHLFIGVICCSVIAAYLIKFNKKSGKAGHKKNRLRGGFSL